MYEWVNSNCVAIDWLLKLDDDVFVDVERVVAAVERLPRHEHLPLGFMRGLQHVHPSELLLDLPALVAHEPAEEHVEHDEHMEHENRENQAGSGSGSASASDAELLLVQQGFVEGHWLTWVTRDQKSRHAVPKQVYPHALFDFQYVYGCAVLSSADLVRAVYALALCLRGLFIDDVYGYAHIDAISLIAKSILTITRSYTNPVGDYKESLSYFEASAGALHIIRTRTFYQ